VKKVWIVRFLLPVMLIMTGSFAAKSC